MFRKPKALTESTTLLLLAKHSFQGCWQCFLGRLYAFINRNLTFNQFDICILLETIWRDYWNCYPSGQIIIGTTAALKCFAETALFKWKIYFGFCGNLLLFSRYSIFILIPASFGFQYFVAIRKQLSWYRKNYFSSLFFSCGE